MTAMTAADRSIRPGTGEVPNEKAASSTSVHGNASAEVGTHVLIEPGNDCCTEVGATGQSSEEGSPKKRRAHRRRPGGENEKLKKRRRRSISIVSSDEVSVDSHGDDGAVDDESIPTHVVADTVTKPLRRIPLLPTRAPMRGSGVFYDGAELPIALGNHPLMSSPACSPSPSKDGEGFLSDDARAFLQAPEAKVLHPTAFLPLLPCPKLPSRPVVKSSMPFTSKKTDDSKGSSMSLDGSRHILTEEANRILQQEKMDRLRSYLFRRDAMKRRGRKKGRLSEDEDNNQKKNLMLIRRPLLPVVQPTPSPPPPPSSNSIVRFNSCSPDILDAALALTTCLSRAPSLPSKEGPKKNFTKVEP